MNKPDNGLNEELRDLSPLLGNLWEERDKILAPPPHYFDYLPDEVIAKVRLHKPAVAPITRPANSFTRTIGSRYSPMVTLPLAAATFTLLAAVGIWFFLARDRPSVPCTQFDCLQAAEVQEYVQGNPHDFPLDLILDLNDAEKALQGLTLPLPMDPNGEELRPILIDILRDLDSDEIESIF